MGYLLLAAFLGSGCLTVVSDQAPPAATTGGVIITGTPQASCVPRYLIFAPTADGTSTTLPVYCTNVGSAASGMNLTMEIAGTGNGLFAAQFGPDGYPAVGLSPDQSVAIETTYTPSGISQDTGVLEINTNGGTVDIPLFGDGVNATCTLMVPTEALDFGSVVVGATSGTTSFAVDNVGISGCEIEGPLAILNDPSNSFHVVSTSVPLDSSIGAYVIQPSENMLVTVDFAPTVSGQISAEVADFIGLTGSGESPP